MIVDRMIEWICERTNIDKSDLAFGLAFGLAAGLAAGLLVGLGAVLAFGLAFGLVAGLVVGLMAGSVFGLAAGLVVGLMAGSVFGLGEFLSSLTTQPYMQTLIIIISMSIIILGEILFLFDKKKPNPEQSKMKFTIKRKAIAIAESSLIIGSIIGVGNLIHKWVPELGSFLSQHGQSILSVVGSGTAIVLVIVFYIWLNSLKYRNVKRGRGRPKGRLNQKEIIK